MVYTIAWVALCLLHLQIAHVRSENVENTVLLTLIKHFCKDLYHIDLVVLDQTELGLTFARCRSFVSCRHKTKCLAEISPLARFSKALFRAAEWSYKDAWFMMMPGAENAGVVQNERQLEVDLKQRKKDSKAFGQDQIQSSDEDAFWRVLTHSNVASIERYERLYPNMAWALNQNAGKCPSKSTEWCLQTLIHNFGELWLSDIPCDGGPRRWLFATEALATLGFPIVPWIRQRYPELGSKRLRDFCSFNLHRESRDPRHVVAQVGNSMSVPVMSILHLHSFICVHRRPVHPLLRNIYMVRKRRKLEEEAGAADARDHEAEENKGKRQRMRTKGPHASG
jgi:site-specific DNA-cytosine methylase